MKIVSKLAYHGLKDERLIIDRKRRSVLWVSVFVVT